MNACQFSNHTTHPPCQTTTTTSEVKRLRATQGRYETHFRQNRCQQKLTETQSIATLNHPYIVKIFDYGHFTNGSFVLIRYRDIVKLSMTYKLTSIHLDVVELPTSIRKIFFGIHLRHCYLKQLQKSGLVYEFI